jgi:hypothetical protein
MKKILTYLNLALLNLLVVVPGLSQKDIFKGIFEKEEPVFNTNIVPTNNQGEVLLIYYFSHSKVTDLEASIWMKDNGRNLLNDGSPQMVRELKKIGNRQRDTILIKGLSDNNFYSFGLDYKWGNAFKSRFVSKVLQEGYLYRYELNRDVDKPAEPIVMEEVEEDDPCVMPDIFVRVEKTGYCSESNRPAIVVECENCLKKSWEFSVEVRTDRSSWENIRIDGKRQQAFGNVKRTEPFCVLDPGSYYLRVLAWGENCDAPIVYNVSSPVVISDLEYKTGIAYMPEEESEEAPQLMNEVVTPLPDSCVVNGWGMLYGNFIQGTLEMKANSPCADLSPYAKITYIHPGHRNLVTPAISLMPGQKVPFNIELDEKDILRGIHPIQITVYIKPEASNAEALPISSFWIRAKGKGQPLQDSSTEPGEELTLTEETKNLDIPNCSSMEGLQLIFASNNPQQPKYISWQNPNCCQGENCSYFVWAGSNPLDLRLLSQGKNQGAVVREPLFGLETEDKYFEVVVTSTGGTRRATYVLGEGAKYDQSLTEYSQQQGAIQNDIIATRGVVDMPMTANLIPKRPLTDFGACKIYREVSLTGDFPIHEGDDVNIRYDHTGSGYKYTLYHQPIGASEWLIAPGTAEMQNSPNFMLTTSREHSGRYIVLVYKASKKWGCLSSSPGEALKLSVKE